MNPSSKGWINKYQRITANGTGIPTDLDSLYNYLKASGFIYGVQSSIAISGLKANNYSSDEIAKLQVLDACNAIYKINLPEAQINDFLGDLYGFYYRVFKDNYNELRTVDVFKLEKFIHNRVSITDNSFFKSFHKNVSNRLLFIDVLAFHRHINQPLNLSRYIFDFEKYLWSITYEVAQISLKEGHIFASERYAAEFKDSFRTKTFRDSTIDKDYRSNINQNLNSLEKLYILDLSCFICYSDLNYSQSDLKYLTSLAKDMEIPQKVLNDSINDIKSFFSVNETARKHFEKSNPILNFFNHNTVLVAKLVERNKKRIYKEIGKSQELIKLVVRSQNHALSKEEQARIQFLLKDIVRTIPGLAILLLPGGAILLPIFAKLLPDLMPTSFDDNLD